jgi:hypothetical protein
MECDAWPAGWHRFSLRQADRLEVKPAHVRAVQFLLNSAGHHRMLGVPEMRAGDFLTGSFDGLRQVGVSPDTQLNC